MPWEPMKAQERWALEKPSETIVESTPKASVMPRPRALRVTWIDKEKAGAERIIFWLTVWILSATFVGAGVGVGFVGARFYEVALIIFGGG